jgi:hypothetical protein
MTPYISSLISFVCICELTSLILVSIINKYQLLKN